MPGRNFVIVRPASFATPKENVPTNTIDGMYIVKFLLKLSVLIHGFHYKPY